MPSKSKDADAGYSQLVSNSLARTIDFLKFAEAKNAALLTFASAWALAITSILSGNRVLTATDVGALAVSRFLFIIAVIVAAWSFVPKLRPDLFHRDPQRRPNLLYFGDIARFEFETLKTRLQEAYRGDASALGTEHYLHDLSAQLWINSRIAYRKFTLFNIGISITFLAILAAMVPATISAIHWMAANLPKAFV